MISKKKFISAILAISIVAALAVGGTLAYLTSTTSLITNTFTVGNVKITMDEAKVNDAGEPVDANGDVVALANAPRVTANTYKLMPGHTYTKDPTIKVDATSEDCWLFVKITDEITAIEGATTVANQLTANNWTAVTGQDGVYAYANKVSANASVPVFGTFTIANNADVSGYAGKTITLVACAVQADGFATAAAAAEHAVFG